MNRISLIYAVCMFLALASPQLLAKTPSVVATGDDQTPAASDSLSDEEQAQCQCSLKSGSKPAAQGTQQGKSKPQQTQIRGQSGKAPRWHRFIPGMIR